MFQSSCDRTETILLNYSDLSINLSSKQPQNQSLRQLTDITDPVLIDAAFFSWATRTYRTDDYYEIS